MLGSTVLDVAIGVVLTFLAVSLAASAITEAISSALKWREDTLVAGIRALVSDDGVALALYNHALVNPLSSGLADDFKALTQKPAYIDAKDFATALYGVLHREGSSEAGGSIGAGTVGGATGATGGPAEGTPPLITKIANPQLRTAMTALWLSAGQDVEAYKREIGHWFDHAMDRLSGWYKQKTQVASFVVALVIAACANTNVLYEGAQIWSRPGVIADIENGALGRIGDALKACDLGAPQQAQAASPAGGGTKPAPCVDVIDALDKLKAANLIGWGSGPTPTDLRSTLMAVLSWLIVAGSTLFGASFWFDTLQRITQLRGTGLVPRRADGQTPKPDIAGRK